MGTNLNLQSELKVHGGKLVKVSLEVSPQGTIAGVRITGDFFIHPEDALEIIEESLKGAQLDEKEIVLKATKAVEKTEAVMVGFSPCDIAQAILMAAKTETKNT